MFEAGRLIAFINFLKIPVNVGYYRTRLAYIIRIIWIVLLPYSILFKYFVKVSTGKKKKRIIKASAGDVKSWRDCIGVWRKYSINFNQGSVTSHFFWGYTLKEWCGNWVALTIWCYKASQPSSYGKISMRSWSWQNLMRNTKVKVKRRSKQLLSSFMTMVPIM